MEVINRNNIIRVLAVFTLLGAAFFFYTGQLSGIFGSKDPTIRSRRQETQVRPREIVTIDDQDYEVKEPWLGHRIEGDFDPARMDLVRLPVELVFESRNIYVTRKTHAAFILMAEAAAGDGVEIMVDSGYRSAAYQQRIYLRKMAKGDGFYKVARWVAPPGYSEHMLGTTLDLVPSNWAFSGTLADKWLQENGDRFSFTQTYPEKSVDGFAWEPWHWKYSSGS